MASSKKSKPSGMIKVVFLLLSLAGIIFFKQAFLLLLVGMLPTMVVAITDRNPGRALFQTVLSFNFSGAFYFFMQLVQSERSGGGSSAILSNGTTWFSIYASAAIGYIVYYGAPYVAYGMLRMAGQGNLLRLHNSQQRLLRDWGPEIRGEEAQREEPDDQ